MKNEIFPWPPLEAALSLRHFRLPPRTASSDDYQYSLFYNPETRSSQHCHFLTLDVFVTTVFFETGLIKTRIFSVFLNTSILKRSVQ